MISFRNLTPASVLRSPAVILFLLTCVFFADLFLTGKTFLLRDGYYFSIKSCHFGWQALVNGSFPLWDTQGTGRSFLDNPITCFLYPPSLVFGLFSPGLGINLFCFINVWLVGLGVYFFTKQMKLDRMPALVAAASVMFSTFVMAYLEFLIALGALPWIFFILGVLARFYQRAASNAHGGNVFAEIWSQRALMGVLALLFALAFTANYPEFLVYPFIGYSLFIVLAAVSERSWRLFVSMILFFGAGGLLSLLIVMPQLGLLWQLLPFSERAASFDARFDMASLSVAHLLKSVFPMIGGKPGFPDVYWSPGTYEFCIGTFYTGALVLLALPFAFLKPWKERSRAERLLVIWGASLAVFGLIISLGNNTPIYPLMWKYVPLMNKLRFASKFLLFVIMGEAVLIAIGIQHILKMPRLLTKRVIAVLGIEGALVIAMGALWIAVKVNTSLMPTIFGYKESIPEANRLAVMASLNWSFVFLVLAFGWILWAVWRGANRTTASIALALVFLNLWSVSRPVQPTGPVKTYDRVPQIVQHVADNRFRVFSQYESAHQYLYADPRPDIFEWALEAGVNASWYPYHNVSSLCQNGIKLQKYRTWMGAVFSSNPSVKNNFLDAAGVRWIAGGEPWTKILWGNASRKLQINTRPTAIPRFTLYSDWQPVASDDDALKYLASVQNNILHKRPAIEETALLRGREIRQTLPPPGGPLLPGNLTMTGEGNHWMEYKLNNTSISSQLLVVSDTWYPGWHVTIDGQEVPLHRANYMFRGVFVPAGEHMVRFDFWPLNFEWFCASAVVGLLLVGALFIGCRRRPA